MSRLRFDATGDRQIRATALGRGTHGVPDVRRMVESQFHIAFPHRVWVAGQVSAPVQQEDGTVLFALHAPTGDEVFVLHCVVPGAGLQSLRELLVRTHDADLEDVVREGRLARVGGLLRYDATRGAVTLTVSELDPTPTTIELTEARERAVQAVADAGLTERQRTTTPRTAPLAVALVGGAGDRAVERVRERLEQSPYAIDLDVRPVDLTGAAAPGLLAQAVSDAAQGSDVVLLVRDEGRPLGLAAYDAVEAARAVADAPVPVVTGLGGRGTRSACDTVSFSAQPTAEAAADWVLQRLAAAESALEVLAQDVGVAADEAATRCRVALEQARSSAERAAQEAEVRAVAARRRARRALFVGAALLAVVVVVATLVVGQPLLLLGLLVPALAVAAALWWWSGTWMRGRGMSQQDDDFTKVLERLHGVRDELAATSNPERVALLRDLAGELVAKGRSVLSRSLGDPVDAGPVDAGSVEAAPADGASVDGGPLRSGSAGEAPVTATQAEPVTAPDVDAGPGTGSTRVLPEAGSVDAPQRDAERPPTR